MKCSGGSTSQCLKTGDDVLKTLNFDDLSLRRSVLGLAVMFLIFLLSTFFFLEFDRMVFLPLGHIGSKQYANDDDEEIEKMRRENLSKDMNLKVVKEEIWVYKYIL